MKKAKLSEDELDELFRRGFELDESGDIDGAIAVYLEAAKLGQPQAQSNLASLLDDVVVPSKTAEAVYWYKRGVRSGSSNCAWNLAMLYKKNKNRRWYLHWLRVADEMGDVDAADELVTKKWWILLNGKW